MAEATKMDEEAIMVLLVRHAVSPRYVTFRFPSLPCAAITEIVG